jgi:hypothetical protein
VGVVRSWTRAGSDRASYSVPWEAGVGLALGSLRGDAHFGFRSDYTSVPALARADVNVMGIDVAWQLHRRVALFGAANFLYAPDAMAGSRQGGEAIGGLSLAFWRKDTGDAGWHVPTASFRVGYGQTFTRADTYGTLNVALEIAPALLF